MGPSGSGKSTLMHCMAGLDRLTSGTVTIGDVDVTAASEKQLTRAAPRSPRLHLPGVQPRADADRDREHHPPDGPRRPQARPAIGSTTWSTTVGLSNRLHAPAQRTVGRPATARRRGPGAGRAGRRSSSPTSRPATSTAPTGAEILAFMRHAVRELGQTIVMVTHDPVAASYSHRVVFLADGRVTDQLARPDPRCRARPHAPAQQLNPPTHTQNWNTVMFRLTIKNLLGEQGSLRPHHLRRDARRQLRRLGASCSATASAAPSPASPKRSPPASTSRSATSPTSVTPRRSLPTPCRTVAAVDGVADAVASIEAGDNAVRPIRANGDTIPTNGPPQLAFNWIDNEQLSAFTLVDGAPPRIGEFTMDVDAAAEVRLRHRRHLRVHGARWPSPPHPVGHVVVRRRQLDARRRAHADEHRRGQRAVRHRRHQQRRRAGRRRRRRRPPFRPPSRAAVPDRRGRRPRHRARRRPRRSSPTRSTSSATSCSGSAASRCSCRSSSSTTRSASCWASGPASSRCCARSVPTRRRSGARCSARPSRSACSPRSAASAAASASPRASMRCSV